jgi:hypothetical protein
MCVCAESEVEPKVAVEGDDSEAAIAKLDLQLTYLWKVHGLDFYAGKELSEPMQYKLRLTTPRMVRGPRPEEGEQPTEAEGLALTIKKLCIKVQLCALRVGPLAAALVLHESAMYFKGSGSLDSP